MGFSSSLKNNDGISLRLESPEDAKATFMQAIEGALKRRVIKFEIDVGPHPQVVGEILSQMLALQKVLAKRGEKIRLRSRAPLPTELLGPLHTAGVEVSEDLSGTGGAKPITGTGGASHGFGLNFPSMYTAAKAGEWPRVDVQFHEVCSELQQLIQSEQALLTEMDFYKKRLTVLRPLEGTDPKQVIVRVAEQERELEKFRSEVHTAQTELSRLSQDLQRVQQGYRNLTEKLDPVTVKRFEASIEGRK